MNAKLAAEVSEWKRDGTTAFDCLVYLNDDGISFNDAMNLVIDTFDLDDISSAELRDDFCYSCL